MVGVRGLLDKYLLTDKYIDEYTCDIFGYW